MPGLGDHDWRGELEAAKPELEFLERKLTLSVIGS